MCLFLPYGSLFVSNVIKIVHKLLVFKYKFAWLGYLIVVKIFGSVLSLMCFGSKIFLMVLLYICVLPYLYIINSCFYLTILLLQLQNEICQLCEYCCINDFKKLPGEFYLNTVVFLLDLTLDEKPNKDLVSKQNS